MLYSFDQSYGSQGCIQTLLRTLLISSPSTHLFSHFLVSRASNGRFVQYLQTKNVLKKQGQIQSWTLKEGALIIFFHVKKLLKLLFAIGNAVWGPWAPVPRAAPLGGRISARLPNNYASSRPFVFEYNMLSDTTFIVSA